MAAFHDRIGLRQGVDLILRTLQRVASESLIRGAFRDAGIFPLSLARILREVTTGLKAEAEQLARDA